MTAGRGRSLAAPSQQVAADDGSADIALLSALAAADLPAVRRALSTARVFVPVAAHLVSADATGADKQSDMALLLLAGPASQALPVFSSVETLAAWEDGRAAGARPVAVSGSDALAHACAERLAALVVDVAGPHQAVLEVEAPGDAGNSGDTGNAPNSGDTGNASTYRPGAWTAGKRVTRALRRSGAVEAYLLQVGDEGRPAIGLVLPAGTAIGAVVDRLARALDQPVDIALLDEAQRAAVLATGATSIL